MIGLMVYTLRSYYKEQCSSPLDRVTAQALLDTHTKGISLYAYSVLHFAFDCKKEELESIDRFTGHTILEGFKTSYNRTQALYPNLDDKPLTLAKVLAKISPHLVEKLFGSLNNIYPTLLMDDEEEQIGTYHFAIWG